VSLPGPPPNPRLGRQRFLVGYLQAALVAVTACAAATVVLPDTADRWSGGAMVALLVLVPAARLVWLLVRWTRLGDRRFASAAAGLLAIMAAGAVLAAAVG
jgi:hypothetical protein